jgi:hypothetical protein
MSDSPAPAATPIAVIDTIHSTVQAELSERAERLARMQSLYERIEAVKTTYAGLLKEAADIRDAFATEMGGGRA